MPVVFDRTRAAASSSRRSSLHGQLITLVILFAIQGGCATGPDENAVAVHRVVLGGPDPYFLIPGEVIEYRGTAQQEICGDRFSDPCHFADVDVPLTWSSSDAAVATVQEGLVRAVAAGSVRISVEAGGRGAAAEILVSPDTRPLSGLTAGPRWSCARDASAAVFCWGDFRTVWFVGAPPNPFVGPALLPTEQSHLTALVGLSLGNGLACGIDQTGALLCEETNGSYRPRLIGGPVVFVSAGGNFGCGIWADSMTRCWGYNYANQLGNASSDVCSSFFGQIPCSRDAVVVRGTHSFSSLSAGGGHACGIDQSGQAWCWGANESGQLGVDSTLAVCSNLFNISIPCSMDPLVVPLSFVPMSIHAGAKHTCALAPDGIAHCWGANDSGQLGRGVTDDDAHPDPEPVQAPSFIAMDAGGLSCGLTSSGSAYCWGASQFYGPIPRLVPIALAFRELSVGLQHACGIPDGGRPRCWGNNGLGQLGAFKWEEWADEPLALAGPPGG